MTEYTGDIVVDTPELFALIGSSQVDAALATQAIAQANEVIEAISGVILDSEFRDYPISVRDAYYVKKAILFQAVWLLDQSDSLSRIGANSVNQDGQSISAFDETTFVLSPLAKKALGNCSWNGSSTISVGLDRSRRPANFLIDDDLYEWTPLGGGN